MAGGEMSVTGRPGDTKMTWDPENADEVAAARKHFNELRAKQMLAFSVQKNGTKGEQIHEFDPEAKAIIMTPRISGGI